MAETTIQAAMRAAFGRVTDLLPGAFFEALQDHLLRDPRMSTIAGILRLTTWANRHEANLSIVRGWDDQWHITAMLTDQAGGTLVNISVTDSFLAVAVTSAEYAIGKRALDA